MFTTLTNWLRPNSRKPNRRTARQFGKPIEELEDRRVLDAAYYSLIGNAGTFAQDWTTDQITADGDWSGVPSILGFTGNGLAAAGTNPATITGTNATTTITANQNNPGSSSSSGLAPGGIVEFEISDRVVALAGDGTNQAPYLLIHLNTTNTGDVSVSYTLRDIDSSSRSVVSPVALQYRIGTSGNFINVPTAFVSDASTGGNSKATNVSATLPASVNDQPQVQVRIITVDALSASSGNPNTPDEWIGVDDIVIHGNVPPVIGINGTTLDYDENDPITFVDPLMVLTDIDSNDFQGGKLSITYAAVPTVDDRLIINNQGTGVGQISVTGSLATGQSIQFTTVAGTATIGTANANGGVGLTPLLITFTSSAATPTAVRSLLRNIGYLNVSDDPLGGTRTVQFTVSDGDSNDNRTSALVSRDINVIPINDNPVVSLGNPLVIAEGSPPVTISPTTTITDPDSHDYDGGTLSVFIPTIAIPTAFDQITIENQGIGAGQVGVILATMEVTYSGTVIGTYAGGDNGTPLVITFNVASAPTPQSIQAVARAIQYQNTSDNPPTNPRAIRFIAFDNDADGVTTGISTNTQVTVTIQAVNDAPVIASSRAGFTYTENDAPTAIDSTLTLTDPDSPDFSNGSLTADYTAGGTVDDRLTIRNEGTATGQVSISGAAQNIVNYNFGSGPVVVGNVSSSGIGTTKLQVTFLPAASLTAVLAVLRNVAYSNVSDNPITAPRTVQIVVADGDDQTSAPVTWTINVGSVNDGPTIGAVPASLSYMAGFPAVVVAPAATVSDPDSTSLNTGYFRVDSTGGLNADVIGIRNQGTGLGRIGTNGANVTYSGATIGTFTGGTAGAPLIVTLNSAATPAPAVQALAEAITFRTPNGVGVTGVRTLTFSAIDAATGGTVSNTPSIAVTVTSNAGPNDDFYEIDEDFTRTVAANGILANDPNPAQLVVNATPIVAPTKGALTLGTDGSFQYVPTLNANGTDTFTYQWTNTTTSATGTAIVTIIINAVNDKPTATFAAGNVSVDEDAPAFSQASFAVMGPGGGADEAGQTLTRTIANDKMAYFVSQPVIDSSGRLTFTAAPNANGVATVTLTLKDSGDTIGNVLDDDTEAYTFTITINAVNDVPSFQLNGTPPTVNEDKGAQTVIGYASNFKAGPVSATDETTQTPTYNVTSIGTTGGLTFTVPPAIAPNGDLTYTAAPNSTGTATFIVAVQDSGGTANNGVDTSGPKTFTITIGAVEDPPTLVNDTATVLWNSDPNPIAVLANDSGAPDAGDTISVTGITQPAHGIVAIQAGGTGVTYTPTPGYTGSDTFTYTASDNHGTPATATVTVSVVQYQTQPVDIVAIGTGPGGGSKVRLYNSKTGAFVGGFSAYAPDFQGGVSVAIADVNGDGTADIVVGAGPGGGPHIQVVDGNRLGLLQGLDQIAPPSALLGNFFGYAFDFRGGVTVASGDVNGDGKSDIILGTGPGGAAHVKIISGAQIGNIGGDLQPVPAAILASYFAYDSSFRGGVLVATGDVNRDGYFDVIAAAGPGGASHVKAFSGRKLFEGGVNAPGVLLASFYGFDPKFRGGATIAAGDFNNDGYDDFIVGAGPGAGSHVKVFSPFNLATPIASFFAFESSMTGGVSVAYRMRSGGSVPLLLAGTGAGTNSRVKSFAPPNFTATASVDVFDPGFMGGVDVG